MIELKNLSIEGIEKGELENIKTFFVELDGQWSVELRGLLPDRALNQMSENIRGKEPLVLKAEIGRGQELTGEVLTTYVSTDVHDAVGKSLIEAEYIGIGAPIIK